MRGSKVLVIWPPVVGLLRLRWCGRGGGCAECAAETAGREVEVGVVEDVVGLGAELDACRLSIGVLKVLVEGEVGLVEGRRAAWVARGVAEGADQVAVAVAVVAGRV